MDQHPAITKWAIKKFGLTTDAKIFVEEQERSTGYCETCYHSWKVWCVIERKPGQKDVILKEFENDLASILREILDDAT
jgi:hypothetical protein